VGAHDDEIDVPIAGVPHDLIGRHADAQRVFRPELSGFLLAYERFEPLLRRSLELNTSLP
jgi:hypothetical protein